ncbi:hypothetical protein HMI01_10850 [Halolactibacillus miurensis]|uniref:Bacteriophage HK97-gp10, putative tail-component n=1 Tax=Halolactibacillus miurensis TaxID=306541 RepID=A0A1I6SHP3_9BACI|nr:HK97 gp10 family phage protein [Halolactibacillus miurensis]GEM04097.1 hypothetical protein HMI01_10850 [Halolactibacillus miurensis]SFS76429.1 Bacteriophage HK97-gp10, putative tail-component [Halolactibacillus miurensis]
MSVKTGVASLSDEITKALQEYSSEVEEGLELAKEEIAKETVKDLKKRSPKETGSYRKGWSQKKVGNARVVHNRTDYQLTHLLENGHVKRGGGRVQGIPHIRPAEEQAINAFTDRVERVIRG